MSIITFAESAALSKPIFSLSSSSWYFPNYILRFVSRSKNGSDPQFSCYSKSSGWILGAIYELHGHYGYIEATKRANLNSYVAYLAIFLGEIGRKSSKKINQLPICMYITLSVTQGIYSTANGLRFLASYLSQKDRKVECLRSFLPRMGAAGGLFSFVC